MISAVLIFGGLGLIFAIGLAIAESIFTVKEDSRKTALLKILPGVNCGICGFAGCEIYASELLKKDIPVNKCSVGQEEVSNKIAHLLGREIPTFEAQIAIVKCQGRKDICIDKYTYVGLNDCRAANLLFGGMKGCNYGCIGLGTCISFCPFNAITNIFGEIPKVDINKCKGCGLCVNNCPKNVLALVPRKIKVQILCNSADKGIVVRKLCKKGCIGCQLCEKICPQKAINISDNLAFINYIKCNNCGLCIEKCPMKTIKLVQLS